MIFFKLIWWLLGTATAQCWYNPAHWEAEIVKIENSSQSDDEKLVQLHQLHTSFQKFSFPADSVQAHLFHRIGAIYATTTSVKDAINYTQQSIYINQRGWPWCNAGFAARSYCNLGYGYNRIGDNTRAIKCFDSAAKIAGQHMAGFAKFYFIATSEKSRMLVEEGDYEGALTTAQMALQHLDAAGINSVAEIKSLYGAAAQSAEELRQTQKAQIYLDVLAKKCTPQADPADWYSCKVIQMYLEMDRQNWVAAQNLLQQIGDTARYLQNDWQVINTLNQQAFFYRRSGNPEAAERTYLQLESLQKQKQAQPSDFVKLYNNIGHTVSLLQNHAKALQWFQKALNLQVGIFSSPNVFHYPTCKQLSARAGKQMTFICLRNKAEALLQCYRQTGDTVCLAAAAQGFLLADSLFTNMRQSQTGEESKIYWRKNGHSFYQQALEMCAVKKDSLLAYYYMEKSRAALLLDHLNELGANAHLSAIDIQKEEELKLDVLDKKLQFNTIPDNSPSRWAAQQQLQKAQEAQQDFIQSLEQRYPNYYHYKYATGVSPPDSLQAYLLKNKQQWVQYFISDSLLFVLYADGKRMQLHRKVVSGMEQEVLPDFIRQCADVEGQRNNYKSFLQTSARIYDTLLGGIALRPGRLIISPDNALIPFDALCTHLSTRRQMVQDYAISYAYSAGFLLKTVLTADSLAKGDFLGLAPVQFPGNITLAPLPGSQEAIGRLQKYFSGTQLLTNNQATSSSFLKQLPHYRIVTVYTHARSTGSDTAEPELFLADRPVQLSELNKIQRPATQLVLLSACQTNSGRQAVGEGVLSLARGFAMAGVPSTIATLWKADEMATYKTTELFCQGIAAGMPKDIALQKARLQMMDKDGMALPYYWANMTLTGSADAIDLQPMEKTKISYWTIALLVVVITSAGCYWWAKQHK